MPSDHEGATWTVADAKAKLSEVIQQAQTAPQTITRNGKPSVVVVAARSGSERPGARAHSRSS